MRLFSALVAVFFALVVGFSSVQSRAIPRDWHEVKKVGVEQNLETCKAVYELGGKIYCSSKILSSKELPSNARNYQRWNLPIDNISWKLGRIMINAPKNDTAIIEYVKANESVTNWSEEHASQVYAHALSPFYFAYNFCQVLLHQDARNTCDITNMNQSQNNITLVYRAPMVNEASAMRVFGDSDNLYVLQHNSHLNPGKSTLLQWGRDLNKATLSQ